ncbi:MAG TPA: AsmA-like C-terminal region-containing protein, partial [Verrucomicrobiota bacterium]|nr:AsmA-like C-terminal region-containing protein [Verrucomicrobiota bacterium]
MDSVRSSLHFDAGRWRLPDLATTRPEGAQAVDIDYDKASGEYRIAGRGRVLPPVLKPVLGEASAEVLDLFTFPDGVEADVVVFGPWTEGSRMSIAGVLAATNLTFRGERFDALSLGARYTNRLMVLTNLAAARDGAPLTADAAAYDFAADRVFLTNAVSRLEPLLLARLINEEFPEKIRHYQFSRPPRIVANGTFERARTDTAAMRFQVDGEDFAFWKLRASHVMADLDWAGGWLTLTNLNASFYDGALDGWAAFQVDAAGGDTPYRFDARVRSGRLGPLVRDAASSQTQLEGTFDLELHVTSALTSDVMTWNGHGQASLTNGLIWDVPIFGFLSRTLDAVSPGLGSQRFDRAAATFTLADGVFRTTDLQMHSPLVRLDYRGTVDLEARIDTRVEARVLRNLSVLGPLVSLVTAPLTKLFEFRVTGTLAEPEPQPVYVPKFLFWPFQALGWVAGGFRSGDRDDDNALSNVVTNAPAAAMVRKKSLAV